MTNNLVFIQNNQAVTSSLMVAENFEKEHRNITRDIEKIKQEIDVLKFEQMFYEGETPDSYGRPRKTFFMNRDGFTLLAMGFTGSKALQFKLDYINQFNVMEAQVKQLQTQLHSYMIDDPIKRAEKWIEEQKEKQAVQEQLQIAQPKADKYDEFLDSDGYVTGEQLSKIVKVGRTKLYKFLRENGIYTNNNTPYQKYMDKGYFKVVNKVTKVGNIATTVISSKGIDFIDNKIKKHELT